LTEVRRIAIDVMGGDYGPPVTVPAALAVLRKHDSLHLKLIGDEQQIKTLLRSLPADLQNRLEILHTAVAISSKARPDSILRSQRDSSMFLAIDQVRLGHADACVSAGNTGALLLGGRHLLKTISGIDKPAIMATIPATRAGGYSYLLDVGANISSDAEQLFQFALMGAVVASSLSDRSKARVALLNIGEEAHKGTPVIQQAATLLAACQDIEYVGFIEGNQIFDGMADVIVCDGFTGNITIKTSAGAVKVMQGLIGRALTRRWYYRCLSWLLRPLMKDIRNELKSSRYNGATLVGLQGIVVKSHGNATQEGFEQAIVHALKQVRDHVPELIAERMGRPDVLNSTDIG
jgi:phosphate acyltransferase